ncbi:MAG TPA: NCS2 family permease [Streptosporangiales bacterium]
MTRTQTRDEQRHGGLDRFFQISARGSTVGREVRGGLVTFVTMAYIVVLNPIILGGPDSGGTLLGQGRIAAATALVAGVMSILMGVIGRFPLAIAAGLGLNGYIAGLVGAKLVTWPEAMGLVVIEGLVITLLVLTGFRTAVFNAIPLPLKTAISVGIGMFIAFIGLVDGGFVRKQSNTFSTVPVELGVGGTLQGWPIVVFVIGVLLTAVLLAKRVRGAILISIIVCTVLAAVLEAIFHIGVVGPKNPAGWGNSVPTLPSHLFTPPDLSLIGKFSVGGAFVHAGVLASVVIVFSLILSDFFDMMGTIVGVNAQAGLVDERGRLPGIGRALFVDALAAVAGGGASVSSNTAYVESASGVGEGARTGLASVVTGVLLLLAMFFAPLVAVVPSQAASPALVVVGFLMMTRITSIDWKDYGAAIPSFLTIALMPFTYSITNGIGAGFISYVVIKIAQRRAREIHPLLWVVAACFVVYFAIHPIERLLGVS